jgi:hypothetical protein
MNWEGCGMAFQFEVHPWHFKGLRKAMKKLQLKYTTFFQIGSRGANHSTAMFDT